MYQPRVAHVHHCVVSSSVLWSTYLRLPVTAVRLLAYAICRFDIKKYQLFSPSPIMSKFVIQKTWLVLKII